MIVGSPTIEIKGSDTYITLDIFLKFGSMDKKRISYSDPKDNLGISGKGLITSLGIKAKSSAKKYKKARYAIVNVSMKNLLNIIGDFETLPDKLYESKRPKHEPNHSYFYPTIQLAKCMMRADTLKSYKYPVRTNITGSK